MVIFPLDQVPEMARGRGVRLQRHKDGGLSDVTTFKADDGLTWIGEGGRSLNAAAEGIGAPGAAIAAMPDGCGRTASSPI